MLGPEHLGKAGSINRSRARPGAWKARGRFGCLRSSFDGGYGVSEVVSTTNFLAPLLGHSAPSALRGMRAAGYCALNGGDLPRPADRQALQSPPIAAAAGIAQPESNQMTLPFRLWKILEQSPSVTYDPIVEILNPTRLQVDFNSQVFVPEDFL
jgi:hypothetical protein